MNSHNGTPRPLRRRVLGVAVALCLPALTLGVAACGSSGSASTVTTATAAAQTTGSTGFASLRGSGGGSNARSTNAAGGSVGTVTGKSGSSVTVSTPTGGKATVKETSSTVYEKGATKSTASAVTKGSTVLVLGKVDSTTITATEVIVAPAINLSKASANVIAFKSPNTSTSKSVGQIPAGYKQGTGTLVITGSKRRSQKRSASSKCRLFTRTTCSHERDKNQLYLQLGCDARARRPECHVGRLSLIPERSGSDESNR
jgi:hypothetical protein